VRQKLPESRGYPLLVNDIGRVVHPGEVFDAPLPVPGCEPAEAAGAVEDAGNTEDAAEAQSKPRAKGAQR